MIFMRVYLWCISKHQYLKKLINIVSAFQDVQFAVMYLNVFQTSDILLFLILRKGIFFLRSKIKFIYNPFLLFVYVIDKNIRNHSLMGLKL